MPYTPPASNQSKEWPMFTKMTEKDCATELSESDLMDRLKVVKDMLSSSPLSSSPTRRRSAPEALKKPLLKVELPKLPCLVRKKSGEIVKSSLKRGLSEPTTPTSQFPKYVHFNADLEQIRLFNEAQKPQAISAESSDTEDDIFSEYGGDDDDDTDLDHEEPELIISLPNKPAITIMHRTKPVFVETIFLSRDKRKLQGRILVQNIAFQKKVQVRYTFDFWHTVSNIPASFAEGAPPSNDSKNNYDVFTFSIELIDNSRNPIDGKTMYFAVRYSVENEDFWDNNNGSNYQVNFKRVTPPSTPRQRPSTCFQTSPSMWSMTPTIPMQSNLDERSPESSPKFTSDSRRRVMGRYNISDSLSAEENNQRPPPPPPPPSSSSLNEVTRSFQALFTPQVPPYGNYGGCYSGYGGGYGEYYDCNSYSNNFSNENFHTYFPNNYVDGMPAADFPVSPPGFESFKPNTTPIAIPSKPDIKSRSYYDIINQYCFYPGPSNVITS